MMTDLQAAAEAVRAPRKIARELWDAQVRPYDAGDWDAALRYPGLVRHLEAVPRAENTVRGWVAQRAGVWMQRFEIPGTAGPLLPQLRAFKPSELGDPAFDDGFPGDPVDGLFIGPGVHHHFEYLEHRHTAEGEEIKPWRYRRRRGVWVVEQGDPRRGRDLHRFYDYDFERDAAGDLVVRDAGQHRRGEGWHVHRARWAKHLGKLEHFEAHRQLDNPLAIHSHVDRSKYDYLPESGEDCKRVDIHPAAWPMLQAGGELAAWAFEGVLKGLTLLGRGVPTFDTGSVGSWEDPYRGLHLYPILKGFELVIVVPDSDWAHNDQVRRPVMAAVAELRAHGVNAVAAAPLSGCGFSVCPGEGVYLDEEFYIRRHGDACKVGADDLIIAGGEVDDMVTIEWEFRPPRAFPGHDPRRARKMAEVEELAVRLADARGHAVFALKWVADVLGYSRNTVKAAVKDLEDEGRLRRVEFHYHGRRPYGNDSTQVVVAPRTRADYTFAPKVLRDYREEM